ncbi:hypothetical protein BU24DRAFT_99782 [Aaosphaeria arxii CBS 175.79]|uniref:Uncharacterized protein n=1 Tax=Aaosphaeria arxii CBS 175.79 TaxID=1450172 RepID=A0A6A5Y0W2_9PLEO|nr:uncharacterized protein BU24DRAFT_99782 [Aaosphaeria arxii CBS 175.79]KAF2018571.1 hypothetical protein BU24DRAFT_99782 [Aaosphaeria arxii CBS 175.79]
MTVQKRPPDQPARSAPVQILHAFHSSLPHSNTPRLALPFPASPISHCGIQRENPTSSENPERSSPISFLEPAKLTDRDWIVRTIK